jgi:preprotein translocase subunit SecF
MLKNKLNGVLNKIKNINLKNTVKNFKYVSIASLSVILLAVLLFIFIGFNEGFNFAGSYQVNVKFGTEITNENYDMYEDEIKDFLNDNSISNYSLNKIGENYDLAILVRIKNSSKNERIINNLNEFSNNLTEQLNNANNLESLQVEGPQFVSATISNKEILSNVGVIALAIVISLVYMVIRFDIHSAIATLISVVHDVMLTSSLILLFRIQINSWIFAVIAFIAGYSIFNNFITLGKIRDNEHKESNANLTNAQVVELTFKDYLANMLKMPACILLISILLFIFLPLEIKMMSLSLLISTFVVAFSTIFITPSIWSFIYDRSNDKKLQKKLNKDKKDKNEKENLVV